MNFNKKLVLLIILCNLIIVNYFLMNKNDVIYNYEYTQESLSHYASINGKNIYISHGFDSDNILNDAIYIVDSRNETDPDMRIINSYKISKLSEIRDILKVLNNYESVYPSNWNRTINSMEYEWFLHNLAYYLNFDNVHSADVDLNNNDEGKIIPKKR